MVSKAYAKSFADHSFGNIRSIYQQRDNKVLQMLHGNTKKKYKTNSKMIKEN